MPLLLANPEDRFSHIKAHITKAEGKENVLFSATSKIVFYVGRQAFFHKNFVLRKDKIYSKMSKIDFNIYSLSRS